MDASTALIPPPQVAASSVGANNPASLKRAMPMGAKILLGFLAVIVILASFVSGVRFLPPSLTLTSPAPTIYVEGKPYSPTSYLLSLEEPSSATPAVTLVFGPTNNLTELPAIINRVHHIESLTIAYNPIRTLPSTIGDLTDLILFAVMNTNLESLPESIGQLPKLEDLILPGNRLTSFPKSITSLPRLLALDLSHNKITSLPENIGDLAATLQFLDVTDNKLTTLPMSITKLTKLRGLFLAGNKIPKNIVDAIAQSLPNTGISY